jgi:hypothetical protein
VPNQPGQLLTLVAPSAVGGAIAVFSVWLTNRSSAARERLKLDHDAAQRNAQLLRERGEELYVLVDKLLNEVAAYYIGRDSVMQGKLSYNQCLEMEIASRKENPVNFSRVRLLIEVYFPTAREAYARTAGEREKFDKIAREHRRAYETGDLDGRRFLVPFNEAMKSINAAGEILLTRVTECIRAAAP